MKWMWDCVLFVMALTVLDFFFSFDAEDPFSHGFSPLLSANANSATRHSVSFHISVKTAVRLSVVHI